MIALNSLSVEILGYSEDALTLWAVSARRQFLLQQLGEGTGGASPLVLFRPSFGRASGPNSAQFGEFDFIIVGSRALYLGESKWDNCAPGNASLGALAPEQVLRHRIFRAYVQAWYSSGGAEWSGFSSACAGVLRSMDITKPIAPNGSLLAENLKKVLSLIGQRFSSTPQIEDVLVYFYRTGQSCAPAAAPAGFRLVAVDWSEAADGNFIRFGI